MRAHDRDGPNNELFDLAHGSRKDLRGVDVRDGGRGCQLAQQLAEVIERVIRHLQRWFLALWHTIVELRDESTALRLLGLVDVRKDTINDMLECRLRATRATEHGKNRTTTSTRSRESAMAPHHGNRVVRRPPSPDRAPAARRPERESPGACPTTPLFFSYPSVVLILSPPSLWHCPHRPHCWVPHGPTSSIQQVQQQHESRRPPSTSNARQRQQPRPTRRRLSREQASPEQ